MGTPGRGPIALGDKRFRIGGLSRPWRVPPGHEGELVTARRVPVRLADVGEVESPANVASPPVEGGEAGPDSHALLLQADA